MDSRGEISPNYTLALTEVQISETVDLVVYDSSLPNPVETTAAIITPSLIIPPISESISNEVDLDESATAVTIRVKGIQVTGLKSAAKGEKFARTLFATLTIGTTWRAWAGQNWSGKSPDVTWEINARDNAWLMPLRDEDSLACHTLHVEVSDDSFTALDPIALAGDFPLSEIDILSIASSSRDIQPFVILRDMNGEIAGTALLTLSIARRRRRRTSTPIARLLPLVIGQRLSSREILSSFGSRSRSSNSETTGDRRVVPVHNPTAPVIAPIGRQQSPYCHLIANDGNFDSGCECNVHGEGYMPCCTKFRCCLPCFIPYCCTCIPIPRSCANCIVVVDNFLNCLCCPFGGCCLFICIRLFCDQSNHCWSNGEPFVFLR